MGDARQREEDDNEQQHSTTVIDTNSSTTTTNNNNDYSTKTTTNIYIQGFYGIIFPIFIWTMCFIRAYQFQTLIAEAETDMQNRFDEILNQQQEQQDDDVTLQADDHSIV